jgi:hypothetical protein
MPPETNPAIDFYNWHARIELCFERRLAVNIDAFGVQSMLCEHALRIIAKMAALARIKHNIELLACHR